MTKQCFFWFVFACYGYTNVVFFGYFSSSFKQKYIFFFPSNFSEPETFKFFFFFHLKIQKEGKFHQRD